MQGWHAGVFLLDCVSARMSTLFIGASGGVLTAPLVHHGSQTHVNLPTGEETKESGILDEQINLWELGRAPRFDASQRGSAAPVASAAAQ